MLSTLTMLVASASRVFAPCFLCSLIIEANSNGGSVYVYRGHDSASGELVGIFMGGADDTRQIVFNPPALFEQGLYIEVSSTVDYLTVQTAPVPIP